MLAVKPVELLTKPLDGQVQYQELNAPASGEIYLGQVVKNSGGTAALVGSADTTGYMLAVSDTSPTLPDGSYVNRGLSWHAARPGKLRVVPLKSGDILTVSVNGTLLASHIGQRKTFTQSGNYTVLDLASAPASGGVLILGVAEGRVGAPNARVLVQVV